MITFIGDDGDLQIIDLDWLNQAEQAMLLRGQSQRTAGKLRRLFADLAGREAALRAAVTPAQAAITYGDYYRYDFGGSPVQDSAVIYGQVLPLFGVIAAERAAGAGPGEIDQLVARIREGYARGWRHVRAWSAGEPDGETGDTHIGAMEPLTAAQFDAARRAGWPA